MSLNEQDALAPSPRLPLKMTVEFRRNYARQNSRGVLRNISLSGAFVETIDVGQLESYDKIILTLVVSGRRRRIPATIVWKNQMGCGIRFKPFNNRDIQLVDDLMYFVENTRESRRSVLNDILKRVS
jgi:hypothetical protein